jgi:O-acetyl-ADP-ribose deacetylase (regulator of RNase III)
MIRFTVGDILKADVEALVNTVNCVGIMGRGIALQFKNAFPDNFKAYSVACSRDEVQPGRMFVFKTGYVSNPKYIINFPTKRHWRGKSRLEDIDSGLIALVREIRSRSIKSVAMPPLGSGLGGLDWSQVRPRIENVLSELVDVDVIVFEPRSSDDRLVSAARKIPTMTPGRAALVGLIKRYLGGLMDPFVTLLEVHKLMYFMQVAGEPLKLRYVQAPYGPYAENLRHVLRDVEGYYVSGYADGGDDPTKQLTLVPGAAEESDGIISAIPDVQARFDRVADLVRGFETPIGLELLATVHWVWAMQGVRSDEDVLAAVYSWNDRKRQFTPRQVKLATDVLRRKGWLN